MATLFDEADAPDETRKSLVERRRSKRVSLALPIEVSGREQRGNAFCDRTVTLDVSQYGCRFQLDRQIERGDELAIACEPGRGKHADALRFQVVWAEPAEIGSIVGAMQVQAGSVWPAAVSAA